MWYMMGSSTVSLVGCAMFFILMFQPQMQISVEEEANYVYVAHPAAALMRTLEEEANYVIAPPAPLMIFHDKAEITAFPRINRSTTTVQELYYAFFKGCELIMDSEMPEEPTDGDAYEDAYYVDRNVVDDDDGGQDDGGHDDDDDDEENPNYDYAGDDSSDDDDDDDDDDDSSDDDDDSSDDDDSGSSSDDEEDDDEAAREEWEAFRNQYL